MEFQGSNTQTNIYQPWTSKYLPARMLRAGIVFGGVCLSVCPHKISKTTDQKLM